MTSKKPKTHQKLLKNGLLKEEDLLPLQFEDHNEMLKHYGDESLNRFKSQNLSIWGDLSLVGLAKPRFVLLSRDKEYLMVIFKEKYIRVHNFRTKHPVPGSAISPEDLKLEGIITCAAFCDVNKCLFVGSLNGEIMQIDLNYDDIRQGITPVKNSTKTAILTLDVSSDGQMLVYSHSDVITTIDVPTLKERTYFSKQKDGRAIEFKSAYFVDEHHSLLINKAKKNSNEKSYEIKARAADSTPKKKNLPTSKLNQYAKLMQNKKYYVALTNISHNTKIPYTEVQIFAVDDRESPIRTVKFELHAPADYDKLQFHLTDDKKYLFCHSLHTTSLYIHDFTNQNTTPQCAKIPLKEYHFACFANDDSCLALVTEDGRVAVCNLLLEADRILSRHRLNFFDGKKDSLVLSDDGEYVAYFQQNKDVEVLDLRSHRVIFSLQKLENYTEMVSASMEFSNDQLIIEYQAIFATDPGNKKKYIITEKMPSYGSDPVGRSINLSGLEAKSIEPVQNEVEDEAESQEIEPGHVIPGLGTFKELDNHMPNAMPHKSEEHKTVYTEVWEDRKSLTSFVEKEDCLVAVKSSSGTYAFTGFKDSTVKVYTFPKLKFVCSWKNRDQSNLVTIKIPKGDEFILTAHENGYVEIRDFNFTPQSSSAEDASKFYSFERYLRLDKISLIDGLTKPQNYHISYEQTILHLKALANNPDSFVGLEYNKESEVPFLRDKYNKTPLHYLLYHKKIDYGDLDALANYVLEYMYQLSEQNYDEYVKVLDSLKKIIPVLILDLAPGVATKYIEMVAPIEKVCLQDKVGYHVFAENRTVYWPENDFNAKEIDTLRDGQEKMEFQKLCLKIDYTPHSEDILNYAIALGELKKEDLFKVPAIAHLVDYIWISTKRWTFLLFIWFSVLMILLSLSVAISERTYGLEITILVFTSIGLVIEVMQLAVLRLRYWKTLWNNMDLICLILIYIYIIFKLSDFDDELTENWIAALMIFFGYLRWAAYLRLFRQTRQLIEVIVTITRDMFSFLIIMALITLGFSIIFLKFLREEEDYYLWHLYYSYQLWYGNADGIPGDSASVLILECAIMFIMPVVLLNLLVTLMGESRETVKEKAILTDSRTRLAMSIEAISLRRGINYILVPLNKTTSSKTSLFVCVPKSKVTESAERAEEEDKIEKLQEQIKEMKKMLEDSKQAAEKDRQIVELKDQVAEMAQALKDSKDEQTMKFRKLEELAVRNQMLQVQARRSEKLEEQIKQHKQIDPQEFEDVVKHQINEMKTHLRQFMIEETSQIKDYVKESVKECVDKIDKALPKTEAEPTTKNELVNGVEEEEEYERKDSDE